MGLANRKLRVCAYWRSYLRLLKVRIRRSFIANLPSHGNYSQTNKMEDIKLLLEIVLIITTLAQSPWLLMLSGLLLALYFWLKPPNS
ncbi:hypothetical protein [Spirulina sp. 06S082]|uniref:hypothetical protein n=1 Tax=Spirulina sp. 06S082 TaxID=3110248 RepID=UPI002B1F083B|nr:hypothetical protein [Spirulina sp. 06S082]MEA5472075.1 hypothetical protein [Spirulina sp. 06S082]